MFWRKKNENLSSETAKLRFDVDDIKRQLDNIERKVDVYIKETKTLRRKSFGIATEENVSEEEPDINEIMKAFGGNVPIELVEKYKNRLS